MRLLFPVFFLLAACGESNDSRDNVAQSMNERSAVDYDGDGYSEITGDCDETTANAIYIHPGAVELCDGVDNDCDEQIDDADLGGHVDNIWAKDVDKDGFNDVYGKTVACDIDSKEEFVEANGGTLSGDYEQLTATDYYDADGDGDIEADEIRWDCNDTNATVYPGATEVCDGMYNDCDTSSTWTVAAESAMTSTFYADNDGDGYGDAGNSTESCEMEDGWVEDATDCDDTDVTSYPGATEVCDDADNNCDGTMDEGVLLTLYADTDGDAYGDPLSMTGACEASDEWVEDATDCNDLDFTINPGAAELCADDGTDNDCDGDSGETPSDVVTYYRDSDGDLYGESAVSYANCIAPTGWVAAGGDCDDYDDTINPSALEECDGLDNDCDGDTDENGGDLEIQIIEGAGQAVSITGMVNDDTSLSGDYVAGVTGVTLVENDLGRGEWEYLISMNLCLVTSIILDGEFESGSLADGDIDLTGGDVDGEEILITDFDNGDGTLAYELTPMP